MKKLITVCIVMLFGFGIQLSAQDSIPPCPCCSPAYDQFDFWLGEWDVFNPAGEFVGENTILKINDNCVLQENWQSKNNKGTSYNYYHKKDSTWTQVYIGNNGMVLELSGAFKDSAMVLASKKILTSQNHLYYHRIIWKKQNDGSVSQLWEILNENDSLLQLGFDGTYRRKKKQESTDTTGRVTGIGGIFFKSKDPKSLREWYKEHLGIMVDTYGTNFEWRQGADSSAMGFTQWSPFSQKTTYFNPSKKEFMINYRVQNLEQLVLQLSRKKVTMLDRIESFNYGKFIHILDLEGNKIELWEANDIEYHKIVEARTK